MKPESKKGEPDDALSELKKQIDELKQKQQAEMNDMLSKIAQTKTAHETNDNADKLESPKETTLSASESFCVANLRFLDNLVSQVKRKN